MYIGVHFQADRRRKSPPVTIISSAILKCVHMHMFCLKVNMAVCFPDFSACCKC